MRFLAFQAVLLTAGATSAATGAPPSIDQPVKSGLRSNADSAVVVGIEDYAFVPDVPYALRDAQAVGDWLMYTRGVPLARIQNLKNGNREMIERAITQAGQETKTGGTVWIYFAGHGAADPNSSERLLLGDDVRSDPAGFASRGVSLDRLQELAGAGGGQVAIIVDACYNGLGRTVGQGIVTPEKRFVVPDYTVKPAAVASSVQTLQWNAAGSTEMAGPLDPVQHGAFTYFLVGALRGWADGQLDGRPDSKVTAEEAQAYVTSALRSAGVRDQNPVLLVGDPASWVLASGRGFERAPTEEVLRSFTAAPVPAPQSAPTVAPQTPSAPAMPSRPVAAANAPAMPESATDWASEMQKLAKQVPGGLDVPNDEADFEDYMDAPDLPEGADPFLLCVGLSLQSLVTMEMVFYQTYWQCASDLSLIGFQPGTECNKGVVYRMDCSSSSAWALITRAPLRGTGYVMDGYGNTMEQHLDEAQMNQILALPGWVGTPSAR